MQPVIRQMKKPWVVMPVVALLAFGGWFAFVRDDGASADQPTTSASRTVEATKGTMAKTVSADGTIAAAETEDLSFSSAGTVTAVHVKAGDEVEAGQVLAEIDSAALEADVSSAEATLADAQAQLADDEDADASDEQLAADESSVTSAQDQLDAAEEALAGAKLVATMDGTVATVDVSVGEELTSGGTGGTGQTGSGSNTGNSAGDLPSSGGTGGIPGATSDDSSTSSADVSIVSSGRFTVDLGLDATEVADVAVGQIATISLSSASSSSGFPSGFPGGGGFPTGGGFPGIVTNGQGSTDQDSTGQGSTDQGSTDQDSTATPTTTTDGVEGLVTEVGSVADASSGVASYPVTVAFADTSGDYNVGANVTVEITYAEVEDAVQVPAFAVTTGTDGTSTVQVKTATGTETRTVTTGLTSGTMVQITEGLDAGETVVLSTPSPTAGADGSSGGDGGGQFPGGGELPGGVQIPGGGS